MCIMFKTKESVLVSRKVGRTRTHVVEAYSHCERDYNAKYIYYCTSNRHAKLMTERGSRPQLGVESGLVRERMNADSYSSGDRGRPESVSRTRPIRRKMHV